MGCTDVTTPPSRDPTGLRLSPDQRSLPPQASNRARARTRIKFGPDVKGNVAEIRIDREGARIVAVSHKDRAGTWHGNTGEQAGDGAEVELAQDATEPGSAVGTFVADDELVAYGQDEYVDSSGAQWRIKSLGSTYSPPVEEITYRNGILATDHFYSWSRVSGGWILIATRTEVYDYENGGGFVAEVLDSLHHWQSSKQSDPWINGPAPILAVAGQEIICEISSANYFYAQSGNCLGEWADLTIGTVGLVGATAAYAAAMGNPLITAAAAYTGAAMWGTVWYGWTRSIIQLGRCKLRNRTPSGGSGDSTGTKKLT